MATKGKHSWDQGLEQVGLVLGCGCGCGCGTGFPGKEPTSEAYGGGVCTAQGKETHLSLESRKGFRRQGGLSHLPAPQKSLVIISLRSGCHKSGREWRQVKIRKNK